MSNDWYPLAEIDNQGTTGGTMRGGKPRGTVHSNAGRYSARPYYHIWIGNRKLPDGTWDRGRPWVVQYRPIGKASRALRNLDGGVQTNREGDVNLNVALAGGAGRPLDRDPAIYEAFRLLTIWAEQEWGIPRTFPPGRGRGGTCYGYDSPCRFTPSYWTQEHSGWCEHRDVPENTHWDANLPTEIWEALVGDVPIATLPPIVDPLPPDPTPLPPIMEENTMLPIKYGHGYKYPEKMNPPSDLVGDQSHKRADVRFLQFLAGSEVDAGYYGPQTARDIAAALGETDPVTYISYVEWDKLLMARYGGDEGEAIDAYTKPEADARFAHKQHAHSGEVVVQ